MKLLLAALISTFGIFSVALADDEIATASSSENSVVSIPNPEDPVYVTNSSDQNESTESSACDSCNTCEASCCNVDPGTPPNEWGEVIW